MKILLKKLFFIQERVKDQNQDLFQGTIDIADQDQDQILYLYLDLDQKEINKQKRNK